MEQKKRKSSATIASIETEYVRSLQKKASRKHARKIRLYRRLTVFAIVAAIILVGMTQMYMKQKQVLEAKELEKMEMISQLEEVQQEQETLKRQLVKLDDDDYIAKLARKDYFLSENNEIIFSIPENKKKTDKKDNGKE
ncbi:septum formation initiator family protein [Sporosarcina sp. ACRSM]|uniref:septum formation initiator family protein n=1 Tax=Sporosarcina sp. ACRSM TaxID=2918216 RepID=UPI001EF3F003|nr:septum formation initiator family protein [Sporosarcina sp. ACRSM]MCG7337455.1 septum formation initiator family protein [Sporosarcina sp. ACRSM]